MPVPKKTVSAGRRAMKTVKTQICYSIPSVSCKHVGDDRNVAHDNRSFGKFRGLF